MDNIKLKPKQELAIINLLSSKSIEEACKKSEINKTTMYSWLDDEVFNNEFRRRKNQVIDRSIDKLTSSMSKAVDELVKLLGTKNEYLRRLVAKDIIESGLKVVEMEKLEKRVEELEGVVEDNRRNKH